MVQAVEQTPAPADIILSQLGGRRRLKLFINGRDFFSEDEGMTLTFKFMKSNRNKAECIRITLNAADLYDIEFIRIRRRKDKQLNLMIPYSEVVSRHEGYYFDMMIDLFEEETGLALRL